MVGAMDAAPSPAGRRRLPLHGATPRSADWARAKSHHRQSRGLEYGEAPLSHTPAARGSPTMTAAAAARSPRVDKPSPNHAPQTPTFARRAMTQSKALTGTSSPPSPRSSPNVRQSQAAMEQHHRKSDNTVGMVISSHRQPTRNGFAGDGIAWDIHTNDAHLATNRSLNKSAVKTGSPQTAANRSPLTSAKTRQSNGTAAPPPATSTSSTAVPGLDPGTTTTTSRYDTHSREFLKHANLQVGSLPRSRRVTEGNRSHLAAGRSSFPGGKNAGSTRRSAVRGQDGAQRHQQPGHDKASYPYTSPKKDNQQTVLVAGAGKEATNQQASSRNALSRPTEEAKRYDTNAKRDSVRETLANTSQLRSPPGPPASVPTNAPASPNRSRLSQLQPRTTSANTSPNRLSRPLNVPPVSSTNQKSPALHNNSSSRSDVVTTLRGSGRRTAQPRTNPAVQPSTAFNRARSATLSRAEVGSGKTAPRRHQRSRSAGSAHEVMTGWSVPPQRLAGPGKVTSPKYNSPAAVNPQRPSVNFSNSQQPPSPVKISSSSTSPLNSHEQRPVSVASRRQVISPERSATQKPSPGKPDAGHTPPHAGSVRGQTTPASASQSNRNANLISNRRNSGGGGTQPSPALQVKREAFHKGHSDSLSRHERKVHRDVCSQTEQGGGGGGGGGGGTSSRAAPPRSSPYPGGGETRAGQPSPVLVTPSGAAKGRTVAPAATTAGQLRKADIKALSTESSTSPIHRTTSTTTKTTTSTHTATQEQLPTSLQHPHKEKKQEDRGAELMTRTGHTVTLRVGKQAAIYHGLGALLNTPSPTLPRGSPRRSQGAGGKGLSRPKSEDVSGRFGAPQHDPGAMYAGPLRSQQAAQSSPALTGARSQEQLREHPDLYGPPNAGMQQSQSYHNIGRPGQPHHQYPADPAAMRSKSTSHLDSHDVPYPDNRQMMSAGTLPGRMGPGGPHGRPLDRPGSQPELYQQHQPQSQPQPQQQQPRPDLGWVGPDIDRDYENYPGPQQQQPQPQPQKQQPQSQSLDRFGGPSLGGDPRFGGQQANYVNHPQLRDKYPPYGMDPRGAHSLSDLHHDDHGLPPQGQQPQPQPQQQHPGMRSKSEDPDHSRVAEWQKQNEMERWGQRPPVAGYGGPPGQGPPNQGLYGQQQQPHHPQQQQPQQQPHPGDHGRPMSQQEDPRAQQYPPGAQYVNSLRGREQTPPFDRRSQEPEDLRPRPSPKPATPTKPGLMTADPRKPGSMYDPRLQQPPHSPHQGPPGSYPPHSAAAVSSSSSLQHPPYSSAQAGSQPPHSAHYLPASTADTRTVHSQGMREKQPSMGRIDPQHHLRRNETPELPPPPPEGSAPPGARPDWPQPGEELPPPPPPPPAASDLEQQIREEEEKMLRRMAGLDPYGRDQPPRADQQRFVSSQQQPEPQRPSPPGSHQHPGYGGPHHQGIPTSQANVRYPTGMNGHPHLNNANHHHPQQQQQPPTSQRQVRPPQSTSQYSYIQKKDGPEPSVSVSGPRPSLSQGKDSGSSAAGGGPGAKRPPVALKPKVMPKPNLTNSPSPWERAEKERANKVREEELFRLREAEIAELEEKAYLTPDEQERLRRLRLDQEFERRVREVGGEDEEEEGDSDTDDITDRPAGRAVLFRRMQEDLEKKTQQIVEGRIQHDREQEQAEREKIERQERRIQQFEQEREEQKQRQMKRQEKQEREAEAYLVRQREMWERQRREQEEQQRNLRQEEERRLEKQREDMRRKREMEKEQLREMAYVREAEERAMRDEELARQKDMNARNERYGYDPAYRAQPAPAQQPLPTTGPPQPQQQPQPQPQPGYPPPAPPERHSSYDIANQHNMRNSASMPERFEQPPGGPQATPRSTSSSALRQSEGPSSAKKSVSFDSNLTVEINEIQAPYGSTSSESGGVSGGPVAYPPQQQLGSSAPPGSTTTTTTTSYPFRMSSSSSDLPPTPFQRPNYGTPQQQQQPQPQQQQPPPPNEVFEQRTPTNQNIPATLVPGPTPGVVGAQEVYRDPRDRIAAQKAASQSNLRGPGPERMSFRDKMSMFAKEAGEQHTPKERQKTSRAQRVIETDLNGQSVA